MADTDEVYVWQAGRQLRLFSYVALAVVLILLVRVVIAYGLMASIGVILVLGAAFQVWWMILRPRLVAGPDGVRVVLGRQPVEIPWREIRRVEAGPNGITIHFGQGQQVVSRFPQRKGADTEADQVADYLARRAAWARKPAGALPRYVP